MFGKIGLPELLFVLAMLVVMGVPVIAFVAVLTVARRRKDTSQVRICPFCGTAVLPGARFCNSCGTGH